MKKLAPFLIDVVLVIVFCLIGRRSHHEGAISAGLFRTLWPFGIGLLLGWALAPLLGARGRFDDVLARFDARGLWPAGVTLWLSTLIIGMVLRVISGQGIAFSFVLVAAAVLALFLLGWRAAWRALS
ncbi:DUF3054 domain-containing protein [Nocardia sp. CA2R105]|uniref:DUF3054 domain-containing protein n=1 Tax=Nocardia coffeae TaxID=2873381 RepID=UPI001CA74948|nr:DUF3054 domain-containing protein [Nocardia coffeae]MBY8859030.1 DUF3054 domain-containing protein [Nocardia coffeae]